MVLQPLIGHGNMLLSKLKFLKNLLDALPDQYYLCDCCALVDKCPILCCHAVRTDMLVVRPSLQAIV
jgi:hypothetical protein